MTTLEIINLNSPLIYKIANKFYGADIEDLYQVGVIGVLKAYKNYKQNGTTKFSTYAYDYIFGEMYNLVNNSNNYKVSKDLIRLYKKLEVTRYTLAQSLGKIPNNFTVKKHVDQISVLQITDVFITHCGMNSVSEALYNGIPLVLFPQTAEQKGVANRVVELNAGIFLENVDSPEKIKNTVMNVLKNQILKEGANKIKDSFIKCGGEKEVVNFIENKVKK